LPLDNVVRIIRRKIYISLPSRLSVGYSLSCPPLEGLCSLF